MKCPNCCSPMLVTDETASPKSHVTFFSCSICSRKHLSSKPIEENLAQDIGIAARQPAPPGKIPLLA